MKKITHHDAKAGKLDNCQICGASKLFEAFDLGFQPSAGALLTKEALREAETQYPLRLNICPRCGLGQLDHVVDGNLLFSRTHYVYRTGVTAPLRDHLDALAAEAVDMLKLAPKSLCVDVGANDGTLLVSLRKRGMKVFGVEPTNMATIAKKENKIPVLNDFFDEAAARFVRQKHGKADLITFTNVFAHMATLGKVMRGLSLLLSKKGVVVSESQYLLDIFERNQFDQAYHEHVRIYSLKSLVELFRQYGMEVFDAKRTTTREGSIKVYAGWKGERPISPNVRRLVKAEEDAGLFAKSGWDGFRSAMEHSRQAVVELAYRARKEGKKFVADSCPTRGVVVMNYYGLHTGLVPYISDQPGTPKVGKYLGGTHNPIVANDIILKDKPDYVLVLAWHYADYIIKNWKAQGLKAKFVIPLPKFKIIE